MKGRIAEGHEWDKDLQAFACKPLSLLISESRFDRYLSPVTRFPGLRQIAIEYPMTLKTMGYDLLLWYIHTP